MRFVFGVLSRAQITGIGIQRLEQSMQSAVGHDRYIGLLDILAANAREHFAVHLELAVSTVVAGGANAVHSAHNHKKQNERRGSKNYSLGLYRHRIRFLREEVTS